MATKKTPTSTSFLFSKRTERSGHPSSRGGKVDNVFSALLLLAAFLGTFFVWPFAADVHQYPKYLVFCLLMITAGAWWLGGRLLRQENTVVFFSGARELVFLCGVAALSILFSTDRLLALFGNPDQVGLSGLAIASFALFVFLAIQCVGTVHAIGRAMKGFIAFSVLAFVFFLCRAFLPLSAFFPKMGLSFFGYPVSVTAFFAVVVALLAAGLLLFSSEKKYQQVILWAGLVLSSGVLVLVGQRPAWLGLAVGLALLLLVRIRAGWRVRPASIVIASLLLLTGLAAGFFGMPSSFRLAVPEESGITVSETWAVARQTLVYGVKPFLFGEGFGSFPRSFARFRPASANLSDHFSIVASPASGALIGLLADGGVMIFLGLLLFLLMSGRMIVRILRDAVRTLSEKTQAHGTKVQEEDAAISLVLAAAFLGGIVASFAFPPTFSVLLQLLLLYTGLLIVATIEAGQATQNIVPSRWIRMPALRTTGIVLLLIVWLGLSAVLVVRGVAEFWYGKGIQAFAKDAIATARDDATVAARLLQGDNRAQLAIIQATIVLAEKTEASSSLHDDAGRMVAALVNDVAEDPALLLGAASAASRLAATTPAAAPLVRDALLALDRIAPGNAALQMLIGDAFVQTKEAKAAVDRYARAVALRPGFVDAYLHWAQLSAMSGDAQTAMDLGVQAARIAPAAREPLVFLVNIALARRGPGDEDRAILALQTLLAQHPDDEQAQAVLAGVLESVHRLDEAKVLYQKLQTVHPENTTFQQNLSRIDAALEAARVSSTPATTQQ